MQQWRAVIVSIVFIVFGVLSFLFAISKETPLQQWKLKIHPPPKRNIKPLFFFVAVLCFYGAIKILIEVFS